jgi:GDPmannose 4,6-dehydratase
MNLNRKKAFIAGITGQDGSYLAELLLAKGYEVHGLIRRSSTFNTQRIDHIYQDPHEPDRRLFLHHGDLLDGARFFSLMESIQPDEVYNLAAQSHVRVSFEEPEYTSETAGLGALRILEAIRQVCPSARFYQASSSEMFGLAPAPQNELTPFEPRSPYGVSKLYSHWMTRNYREAYGLFACSGIMFNHESPRRGETFVTRKITRAVARIAAGRQRHLYLGNLDAVRDWGYAPEYVVAMWKMLQSDSPKDFVVGTGSQLSVRQFAELAFSYAGLDMNEHVRFDPNYIRPTEADALVANPSRAQKELGWSPTVFPTDLVKIMLDHDVRTIDRHEPDRPIGAFWDKATE